MPCEFRGRCDSCGHEWEAIAVDYWLGPLSTAADRPEQRRFCRRCFIHLTFPRAVERASWARGEGRLRASADDPFLSGLLERIAALLIDAPHDRPVPLVIDPVACPGCGDEMAEGDIDRTPFFCPGCGALAGRNLGIQAIVTLFIETPE